MEPYFFDFGTNPFVIVYEGDSLWMVDLKKSIRAKIYTFALKTFNLNIFSKDLDKNLEMRDYVTECIACDNISIAYRGVLVLKDRREIVIAQGKNVRVVKYEWKLILIETREVNPLRRFL